MVELLILELLHEDSLVQSESERERESVCVCVCVC